MAIISRMPGRPPRSSGILTTICAGMHHSDLRALEASWMWMLCAHTGGTPCLIDFAAARIAVGGRIGVGCVCLSVQVVTAALA